MENSNNGTSVFTLLAGVAAGAALGLLFAPESGVKMRRRIYSGAKKMAEPIIDKVQDSVGEVIDWSTNLYPENLKLKEKNNSNSAWITALLAIPVGAAIGILFAPAKGSETRKLITDNVIKGYDSVINYASNITGNSNEETSVTSSIPDSSPGETKIKRGRSATL